MNSACRRNCWSSFKDMKTIRVVAAVIRSENKIFATARGYGAFKGQWEFPGGQIEAGETPEEAALRELKEECGLDGTIVRQLAVQYKLGGSAEYSFEVSIPDHQSPILGYDPEEPADHQSIKEVCWCALEDLSERDRAFLWFYGLLTVGDFCDKIGN